MKKETSRILYDKYVNLGNPRIDIFLKNGRRIHGIIVGYYFSDPENESSPIHHWHIIDYTCQPDATFDTSVFKQGEVIRHCDLATITFEEDNSTIIL